MARLRYVDVIGTIGSGGLTNSATSHTFTAPLTHGGNATAVPTLAGSDEFLLTILNTAGTAISEVIKVTAYNSGTGAATIVRGQEGSTGVAHTSGDKVTQSAYPADFAFTEAWIAPTLTNSWTSYGTPYATTIGYRKDVQGRVYLRGVVKTGTNGTAAYTLPTGYRPPFKMTFTVFNAANPANTGTIDVETNGNVIPTTASTAYISTDGIIFYTD